MDSIVGQIVDRVVAAQDRRAAADVPGAGRPFDPSRGVPLDTLANSATAGFDVHPPLPTLSQEGLRLVRQQPPCLQGQTTSVTTLGHA